MAYFQTKNLILNRFPVGLADLTLDVSGEKVNVLSRSVLDDLDQAFDIVAKDEQFRLLLIRSGKKGSFAAGPDPKILASLGPDQLAELSKRGQDLCDKLARLSVPSVAIISGGCLGGGLELALAFDYRLAIAKPTTIFGFPELELGLVPMWGGSQRLPKWVGLERGLQMLMRGKPLSATLALSWGLIDGLTAESNPNGANQVKNPEKRLPQHLPLRTFRQKLRESTRFGRWLIFRGAEQLLRRRLPDDMPAPYHALAAVRAGLRQGMDAGLAREVLAIRELAETETFRNLIYLHREREKRRNVSAQSKEPRRLRSLGIVGGGNGSTEMTYLAVTRGYHVAYHGANETALGEALFGILALLQRDVTRGKMSKADLTKNLAQIHGTTSWKGFDEVDMVLEAGVANADEKTDIFKILEKQTDAKTLLVTTRSSMTVRDSQEGLIHPERVAGLHFLNPVSRSLLVEMAVSDKTQDDVAPRLKEFVATLGRIPQMVRDETGLLVDRFLLPYWNEAVLLVKEGFWPNRVDEAMVRFGMIHGPLEHLDLMGLDTAWELVQALEPVLQPHLVFDDTFAQMAQRQWLGTSTGIGFYRYSQKNQKTNQDLVNQLRAESHAEAPHRMEALSHKEQLTRATRRLVWIMVNEAAWCLEERRVDDAETLDLTICLAGWAPQRGGPIHYARRLGIDTATRELEELASLFGPRYEPCPGLRQLLT